MNSFLYCSITGTEQEHIFLYKKPQDNYGKMHTNKNPKDNYGKIYINLLGTDGKYYQIFGDASKEEMGTPGLFYDFKANGMGGDFGNFLTETTDIFIVNRFTGYIKDFFYNSEVRAPFDSKIQECHFGKETMSSLPDIYPQDTSSLFSLYGIGFVIILAILICIAKKYLFRKRS